MKTSLFQMSFEFRIHRKMDRTFVLRNDAGITSTSVKSISFPSVGFSVASVTILSMVNGHCLAETAKIDISGESADITMERMPEHAYSLGESDSVFEVSRCQWKYPGRIVVKRTENFVPVVSTNSSLSSYLEEGFRL